MKKKLVIGSRSSQLAVRQSELVVEYLNRMHPELEVSLVTMSTRGDRILDRRLDQIGGKGLFVQELEAAMRSGETDFSVHSLKDMPMEQPEDLPIVCYSVREDPRDVLVLPEGATGLDFSKPIGTSSPRRVLQLKKLFPVARFASIRGNLQTRLRKLDEGQFGAIVLAAAGMKRLGLEKRISRYFTVEEVIPAAGQAILAIQGRKNGDNAIFDGFTNPAATAEAICERAFVKALNGGCSSPIAAHAIAEGEEILLTGFYVPEGTEKTYTGKLRGSISQAREVGIALARELLAQERRSL